MEAFEEERRLKAEIEAMEGEVASYENEVSLVLGWRSLSADDEHELTVGYYCA